VACETADEDVFNGGEAVLAESVEVRDAPGGEHASDDVGRGGEPVQVGESRDGALGEAETEAGAACEEDALLRQPLHGNEIEGVAQRACRLSAPYSETRVVLASVALAQRMLLALASVAFAQALVLVVELSDDGCEVASPVTEVVAMGLRSHRLLGVAEHSERIDS
jgi:hypothetical protein